MNKIKNTFFYIAFLTTLLTTFFVSSQAKNNAAIQKKSFLDSIDIKIRKAYNFTKAYKYDKALTLTLECLKEADSIKNDSLLGKSFLTYGLINSFLGKEKQALLNQRKAATIFKKVKKYKFLGRAYNNIGWIYSMNKQNSDSIIFYYKKALDAYTMANDKRRIATSLNNIGYKYVKLNDFNKAETLLKRALALYLENIKVEKRPFFLSSIYNSLSELYFKKKDLQKAIEYGTIAEKIALKNKNEEAIIEIYRIKNKILDTQGNYTKAHYYLENYQKKLKVVEANEKSKINQEMIAKYEVKKHKTYLEKIRLENQIRENELKNSKQFVILTTTLFIFSLLIAFLLYINNKLKYKSNRLLKIKQQKLKNLQLKAELFFLKTQIQPHFFFNTLNNLYALIIEKSDKANNVIDKLSELMKYALGNESLNKVTVPIQKEISSIKNYLELESLRYEKIASTNILITGEMDAIKVPPLLYITFLENCFKHNNVNYENFKILISFKNISSKYLLFNVQNTLTSQIEKGKRIGIGIENIKRRLKLIYKDDYKLTVSTENNMYSVSLKIPILKTN